MTVSPFSGSIPFLAQTGSRTGSDTLAVIIAPSPCAAKEVLKRVMPERAPYTHLDPKNSNTSFWVGLGKIGDCFAQKPDGSIEAIHKIPNDPQKIAYVQQLLATLTRQ